MNHLTRNDNCCIVLWFTFIKHLYYSVWIDSVQQNGLYFSTIKLFSAFCVCRLDHILLETTGLANPAPLASILWLDEQLESDVKLDSIVTVSIFNGWNSFLFLRHKFYLIFNILHLKYLCGIFLYNKHFCLMVF
jgi:hypothetical protein